MQIAQGSLESRRVEYLVFGDLRDELQPILREGTRLVLVNREGENYEMRRADVNSSSLRYSISTPPSMAGTSPLSETMAESSQL